MNLESFVPLATRFLGAARAHTTNLLTLLSAYAMSLTLFLVGVQRSLLEFFYPSIWVTVFSYDAIEGTAAIVLQAFGAHMNNGRVQGNLTVQRFGSSTLHRVIVDGHMVVDTEHGPVKGAPFAGNLHLPNEVKWIPIYEKLKSRNNSMHRGRTITIPFETNSVGLDGLKASVIHRDLVAGKVVSEEFEKVIEKVSKAINAAIKD